MPAEPLAEPAFSQWRCSTLVRKGRGHSAQEFLYSPGSGTARACPPWLESWGKREASRSVEQQPCLDSLLIPSESRAPWPWTGVPGSLVCGLWVDLGISTSFSSFCHRDDNEVRLPW